VKTNCPLSATGPVPTPEEKLVAGSSLHKVQDRKSLKRKQVLRFGIRLNLNMRHPMLKKRRPQDIYVHVHHRTIVSDRADFPHLCSYTLYFSPWKGSQIPLTLSFRLFTGLVTLFSVSPLALRRRSTLSRISLGSMLRTQMDFSLPQM
jgi:hypothetical protein